MSVFRKIYEYLVETGWIIPDPEPVENMPPLRLTKGGSDSDWKRSKEEAGPVQVQSVFGKPGTILD